MPRPQKIMVAVAWFRADQWELLRTLAADSDKLEKTHAEWVVICEKTIKNLAKEGIIANKVIIDVNDLKQWCDSRGVPLDSSARAQYAVAKSRGDA